MAPLKASKDKDQVGAAAAAAVAAVLLSRDGHLRRLVLLRVAAAEVAGKAREGREVEAVGAGWELDQRRPDLNQLLLLLVLRRRG